MISAALFIFNNCATSQFGAGTIKHEATDLPDHFVVGFHDSNETLEPKAGMGCRNPLVDPRNGNRLELIRSSQNGQGDYIVPSGKYNVGKNELLRIDCATGKALGVVKK